uniref:Uncharacterized protein n=1 Tax=Glossina brevipalpis TaxID=37001 RepID=A0A1A9WG63_9MUSC
MGKCISKNPTSLTIATISEKNLAAASHILDKYSESSEYVALEDGQGNQLYEYIAVNDRTNGNVVVITADCQDSVQNEKQKQAKQERQERQHESYVTNNNQEIIVENICTNSTDHYTCVAIQQEIECDDKANTRTYNDEYDDVVESLLDVGKHITAMSFSSSSSSSYVATAAPTTSAIAICNNISSSKLYDYDVHLANSNNNTHNYYTDIQHSMVQLRLYRQKQWQEQQQQIQTQQRISNQNKVDAYDSYNIKNLLRQQKVKKILKLTTTTSASSKLKSRNDLKVHAPSKAATPECECSSKMDECENLVIGLKGYEALDIKQQSINDNEIDIHQLESLDIEDNNMGQIESKKRSKKHQGNEIQTKGTAMSFGFRKNLNTTPKKLKKLIKGETKNSKKQDKCNNFCEDESTIDSIGNGERFTTAMGKSESIVNNPAVNRDDNGNAGNVGDGVQTTLPGAGSRFGYRGPIRPSSTDITALWQKDSHDNIRNNNCSSAGGGSNTRVKRRSKSAHAGRIISSSNDSDGEPGDGVGARKVNQPKTITFNLKQNSTIEYDRRQFFDRPMETGISYGYVNGRNSNFINTGFHNNVIICPTPRLPATTYSKFTLQTVSLPKPEYAIPISINATTPTTPAGSYASSPVANTGARAKDFITVRGTASTNQYSVTAMQSQRIDPKTAKHMANSSTRRIFCGSREISADSGIASLDMALDSSTSSGVRSSSRHASPKRSRSRPRNLQMVMNGRGKFEVRDLDDSLSSESSSIIEPLALPKLPTENQTVPLPLSGLVRSNTVLSRESYELKNTQNLHDGRGKIKNNSRDRSNSSTHAPSEEDSESIDEEKLHLDRSATEKGIKERQFKDINTCSSKTSSPGSSIISSWCNGGESLAAKDFSNLSLSSSEDSNKKDNKLQEEEKEKEAKIQLELNDDDLTSLTETIALNICNEVDGVQSILKEVPLEQSERPKCFYNAIDENKFAVMALEGSTFLLDDETSPTDSLVSSTESEEAPCKQKKHKINEELQEKDIDEISPELDVASPNSPGTPTHASHSLSLSDCGNLIDDEIADQPALLFNHDSQDGVGNGGGESVASRKDKADTPTLIESMSSMRNSVHSQTKSRSALHQAMELSLRTPLSLRKAVMERAESLDTLSPCESICSDDLMMDFDMNSSIDSIDRSASIKSRSGSDLNKIDDSELFTELEQTSSSSLL